MPHAEHQIFMPTGHSESVEAVLALAKRFTCLPGRVAILMDPVPDTFSGSEILMPKGIHAGKFRPDAGTVISSGVADLERGDRVIVRPYDGLWLTSKDNPAIPEGRELRMYGVSSAWYDSIVAKVTGA